MSNDKTLTQKGGWRYHCTDWRRFKGMLLINHESYSSMAGYLGVSRERVRQFASGVRVHPHYLEKMCGKLSCTPRGLGFERIWARRAPLIVKKWERMGKPEPTKTFLTTNELLDFFGYGEDANKRQQLHGWTKNAGLPVHARRAVGRQNLFNWPDIKDWMVSFEPPGGGRRDELL